jgi:RND family efflux transporter MFP subunit
MKCLRLAAALLLLAPAAHADSDDTPAAASDIQQIALVSTIKLTPGSLPATTQAYGQIAAGPGAERTITLPASGIISSLPVTAGQRVAAGDTLAVIIPDAPSIADRLKAQHALTAARANRAHIAALLASRLATAADLASADQTLADAAATLAVLDATGAGLTRTMTAPQPGIVSASLAAPGTTQPAGTPLLRIIAGDALVAVLGVTPAQAMTMQTGDPARVTLQTTGAVLAATLTRVAAMTDQQTGLIDVTLALRGTPLLGTPLLGMSVQASITTGTLTGYIVPRDAVQTDAQGDYAFQIDAKNIAHRIAVHILGTAGDQTILAPDLNAAMPLVTTGAYQLNDGAAVRVNQ